MENKLDDNRLITAVKEDNCSDSLKTLINKYNAICLSVFRKYTPFFQNNNERFQELFQNIPYLIYRATKSFNPDMKTKFSTWLTNYARYECLNAINSKDNIYLAMESRDLQYYVDAQNKEKMNSNEEDVNFIFEILGKLKDERIKDIFQFRYFEGKRVSWEKIAERMKISTQTAINLHERGKRILSQKLKSKECFDEI